MNEKQLKFYESISEPKTITMRIDVSLEMLIKKIQEDYNKTNGNVISFAKASRVLALNHQGFVDLDELLKFKKQKKTIAMVL